MEILGGDPQETPSLVSAPAALAEGATVYRRMLVPLDGSPMAETVIPSVLRIAQALDLEVVLLRVIAVFPPETPEGPIQEIEDSGRRLHRETEAYLRSVAERLAGHVRVRISVRKGGSRHRDRRGRGPRACRPHRDDDARPKRAEPSPRRLRGGGRASSGPDTDLPPAHPGDRDGAPAA